ncbi:hypothetical protein KYI92_10510 [Pantoea allii]|uniref:Uncharacterized protein n=1 Tax=Pantoea allii TaxID=574096 RepID=A0ABS6VFL4_9GAMM|nr:hypothetical protein [Pantoea allii]MBW1214316.1 hypothetical protein [Pantoea allii]MBW1257598.1 hypothetical protein [Pantoea allii]MBW1266609.1 hypothetical protein [Pantoea allii]MBW1288808.1 hypothetical protein [Pantoea allii]
MKGENILGEEALSLNDAKEFLAEVHSNLQAFLEDENISEDYEMYPSKDVVYIVFRNFLNSKECLKLLTIVQIFELTDIAEYQSLNWWFLSGLVFGADMDIVKEIIDTKIAEEEKSKISPLITAGEDKYIIKRI